VLRDIFVCDLFGAAPKDDLASMEHPMFSLATRPDLTVRRYAHNGALVTITPSVRGRATIHDKDILIYCISQLVAALNAGRAVGRTLRLTAHDLLVATGRDTGGDAYQRLVEAFERLAGTRITTNLTQGGIETTQGFGLIESWEVVRRAPGPAAGRGAGGRMVSVAVTLSEWLFRAALSRAVLTLSRDYFTLRKPLERRLYELVRKHCGRQPEWRIGLSLLKQKTGSEAPIRVFRAAIRRIIADGHLPDYTLAELPGDIILARPIRLIDEGGPEEAAAPPSPVAGALAGPAPAARGPLFGPETLDRIRALAPGWDPYALEAEWRSFWIATGRPALRAPERALLAWVSGRVARG
jgi:hypothetical protein